jgi:hypothetical protein
MKIDRLRVAWPFLSEPIQAALTAIAEASAPGSLADADRDARPDAPTSAAAATRLPALRDDNTDGGDDGAGASPGGWISAATIAKENKLSTRVVSRHLKRWREETKGDHFEVANRKAHEPEFLYPADAIAPLIEQMVARAAVRRAVPRKKFSSADCHGARPGRAA